VRRRPANGRSAWIAGTTSIGFSRHSPGRRNVAPAVILYTSDHGRSYEDSWRAHAVPLMMFGDARPSMDTGYRASHVNIFATLLDLMGFPEEQRPVGYARSLVKARAVDREARVVLSGDLFGVEAFDTEDFDHLH
jgi:hypothetical protein